MQFKQVRVPQLEMVLTMEESRWLHDRLLTEICDDQASTEKEKEIRKTMQGGLNSFLVKNC